MVPSIKMNAHQAIVTGEGHTEEQSEGCGGTERTKEEKVSVSAETKKKALLRP